MDVGPVDRLRTATEREAPEPEPAKQRLWPELDPDQPRCPLLAAEDDIPDPHHPLADQVDHLRVEDVGPQHQLLAQRSARRLGVSEVHQSRLEAGQLTDRVSGPLPPSDPDLHHLHGRMAALQPDAEVEHAADLGTVRDHGRAQQIGKPQHAGDIGHVAAVYQRPRRKIGVSLRASR
jgi:hypothetical protein